MSKVIQMTTVMERGGGGCALSIIMPCYNVEQYLGAVIERLRAQPFGSWELIAVDDASADGTAEALERNKMGA